MTHARVLHGRPFVPRWLGSVAIRCSQNASKQSSRDLIPHEGHQAKLTGPPNRSGPGQKATTTCSPGDEQHIRETAATAAHLGQCRGDPGARTDQPVNRTSGHLSAIVGPWGLLVESDPGFRVGFGPPATSTCSNRTPCSSSLQNVGNRSQFSDWSSGAVGAVW